LGTDLLSKRTSDLVEAFDIITLLAPLFIIKTLVTINIAAIMSNTDQVFQSRKMGAIKPDGSK